MLEADTLEKAIKSTLWKLKVATTAQILGFVKARFPNATPYKVRKILKESSYAKSEVRNIMVKGYTRRSLKWKKETDQYSKPTQVWVYASSNRAKEKKRHDFLIELAVLRTCLDMLEEIVNEYVKDYTSYTHHQPNFPQLDNARTLLATIKPKVDGSCKIAEITNEITTAKITSEYRERVEEAYDEIEKLWSILEQKKDDDYANQGVCRSQMKMS